MKNKASNASTIMGYLVALAVGLKDIDFKNFELASEWPTLVICAVIALGGHMTKVIAFEKGT